MVKIRNIVERSTEPRLILTESSVRNRLFFIHFFSSVRLFSVNRSFYFIGPSINFDRSKLSGVDFNHRSKMIRKEGSRKRRHTMSIIRVQHVVSHRPTEIFLVKVPNRTQQRILVLGQKVTAITPILSILEEFIVHLTQNESLLSIINNHPWLMKSIWVFFSLVWLA